MAISMVGNWIPLPLLRYGHLQLVRDGQEIEIQAPSTVIFGSWQFWNTPTVPHSVPPGSTIGDPATYVSTPVELASGIDEDGAWDLFLQAQAQLEDLNLPYDFNFNSNTFINTLLKVIGHTAAEFIAYPTDVSSYPGVESSVADGFWGLDYMLRGGNGNDEIHGGRGDDVLSGGGGTDYLYGGNGSDTLYAHNDTTLGDGAGDHLTGGSGRDHFYVGSTSLAHQVFQYDAATEDYVLDSSYRAHVDVVHDMTDFDTLSFAYRIYTGETGVADYSDFSIYSTGQEIGGMPLLRFQSADLLFYGTVDTYYDDHLGRDITTFVVFDVEFFNPIFAIEIGGPENATALVSASVDTSQEIFAWESDGQLGYQGNTNDGIIFLDNIDMVVNLQSETVSYGSTTVKDLAGFASYETGGGDDIFLDADTVRQFKGGAGTDSVSFENALSDYRIYVSGDSYLVERAYIDRDAAYSERWLNLNKIENAVFGNTSGSLSSLVADHVEGTSGNDNLVGTSSSDLILAGDGDDTLYGGSGSDVLDGGAGTNRAIFDGLPTDYEGKLNADGTISIVSALYGYDLLGHIQEITFLGDNSTHDIQDYITSLQIPPNATIIGTDDNDDLIGTSGNDVFFGGLGDDVLEGGSGSDTFIFRHGDGNDTIDDWADPGATDILELGSGLSTSSVSVLRGAEDFWDILLDFGNGDSITIRGGFFNASTVIEEVRLSGGAVWTVSDMRQIHINQASTGSDDTINGFDGADDTVHAGAGNDTIYVFGGNDAVFGQEGDDVLFGDAGDDILAGGSGNDFVVGGAGSDIFVFGATDDQDWIDDFAVGVDKIDVSEIASLADFNDVLANAQEWVAGSTWIYADASNYIRLEGVAISDLQASDFVF